MVWTEETVCLLFLPHKYLFLFANSHVNANHSYIMFSQNNLFCLLTCCASWNTLLECCEIHLLRCCGMCFILLKGAVLWNAPPQPQCALEPVPGCTNQCFLGFRLPLALVFTWEPEEQLESSSPPPQFVSPRPHWPVYCGSCLWEGSLCPLLLTSSFIVARSLPVLLWFVFGCLRSVILLFDLEDLFVTLSATPLAAACYGLLLCYFSERLLFSTPQDKENYFSLTPAEPGSAGTVATNNCKWISPPWVAVAMEQQPA